MFRSIDRAVKLFAVLLGITSCQSSVDFPVTIMAPAGATDYKTRATSPDKAAYEISFKFEAEANNYSVVHQLELQLTKAGFRPCGKAGSKWEIVQHVDSASEQNRFLQFYDASDPRVLALILGLQRCDDKNKCAYQYTVRQEKIPESIADGANYVKAICENSTIDQ